jgi:hypothetical protein
MSFLCCFLGRFLPKLGGASAPPFFITETDSANNNRVNGPKSAPLRGTPRPGHHFQHFPIG